MSILGVEAVVFAVDDLPLCTKFWEDFGLRLVSKDATQSVFNVQSGSRVIVRKHGDSRLPPNNYAGNGVRLTVWGVDDEDHLNQMLAKIKGDGIAVQVNQDGVPVFQCPDGQWIGLKVWNKKQVVSVADPVNTPGNIKRLNQHRQWRNRAIPKTINHVVYFSANYVASYEFYKKYLDFRYTDHSRGVGIFARADGTFEHHSIFWVNSHLPFVRHDGHAFMHIAFGMDDIDEVMIGANYMDRQGWKNTSMNASGGISRHRISSAIYYYMDNPSGGEAEYHADTDYVDDNWVPRAWDFKFGSLMWSHNTPEIFRSDDIEWDMQFDADESSFKEYRTLTPLKAELERIDEEVEHAL